MSNFFIRRPIFAWVIAILIMLAGIISIYNLPISQYPEIAPPSVSIEGAYPGASAQVVQDTVIQNIEANLNGLDGLRYMSSSSNSDGSFSVNITFNQGTDPDLAQVQVQNKVQQSMYLLPSDVQQQGVRVSKAGNNFLMILSVYSKDGSMDGVALSDYAETFLKDPLSRIPGVGGVQVFGSKHAMRIWLDAALLNKYKLTPTDVKGAIATQNIQVSFGALGNLPAIEGQELNASVIGKGRLTSAKEFEEIVIKSFPDGSKIQIKDVARVEVGSESYAMKSTYNGQPSTAMAILNATGSNALTTAQNVEAALQKLQRNLPPNIDLVNSYDTTPVIAKSINGVVSTLVEAIVLVFVIMYLFLQDWRATLIPTLAIPVVLLGTFAILLVSGFTINSLTMFAMILAIGLLVDDAIVVVENVERIMHEEGLNPVDATIKSMGQIQGALFGIAVVLSAVFLPMAFFGGSVGVIYKQFSITIISAMMLSVVVALIFTPALCAAMLQPIEKGSKHEKSGFFGWFNRFFDKSSHQYRFGVAKVLNNKLLYLAMYIILVGAIGLIAVRIPSSFLPEEDQGIVLALVQAPTGATADRTDDT
jgi:multidrug efflux pump